MEEVNNIYQKSLKLRPVERLQLIEMIAGSLDQPDSANEKIWAEEAEQRYLATEKKEIKTFLLDEIISRYKK